MEFKSFLYLFEEKKREKKEEEKEEKSKNEKQEETEGEKRKRNYSLRMPNPPNKLESASPPSFVGMFISVCNLSLLS